jgi:uncharacterized repeat protein (TIGR03803 family)
VKGTLFGTTIYGGGRECDGLGCGTVFEIKPRAQVIFGIRDPSENRNALLSD